MKRMTKQLGIYVLVISMVFGIFSPLGAFAASKLELAEWDISKSGKTTVEVDTEIQRSGRAIKFSTDTSASISTTVKVENGKTYSLDFYNKAVNLGNASVAIGGSSYSLKPIESTFDWTHHTFKYTHSGDDGSLTITFSLSGATGSYWLDYPSFKESGGENLIKNPYFEKNVINTQPSQIGGDTLEQQYYNIKSSDSFTVESLEKVQGAFATIPIKEAKNITIDANGDDWADYAAMDMPVLSEQTKVMISSLEEEARKNHASVKFAYDSDRFYFYAEVYDENHVYEDSSNYWQKDSIQFTLSRLTDTYGYEFGLLYNSDEKKGKIYTTAITDTELQAIDFAADRVGNITKYEISIPWMIYYGSVRPDDMLFDLLVNENTGEGRAISYEFAPDGICVYKSNEKFPYLQFLSADKDWYGWIDGERKPTVGEENQYNLFFVNYGEGRDFTFTMPNGDQETVFVEKNSGIREEFTTITEESGKSSIDVGVDESDKISLDIIALPGMDKVEKYIGIFEKDLKEIENLIKKCDKQNLSHDNETAYYEIVKLFMQYMQEDANRDDFSKVDYWIGELEKLVNMSKENLNAYLSGEKSAVPVPQYVVTGEDETDGQSVIATTTLDGKTEKRPVFFIGYGHFLGAAQSTSLFKKLGLNTIQTEVGPSSFLRPKNCEITNWGLEINGADAGVEVTDKEKASGSKSLYVYNNSPITPNVFAAFFQDVTVEPNTEYKFGLKIKAKQADGMYFSMNGFSDRVYIPKDVSDWTEVSGTFKTGEDQTFSYLRLGIDGTTKECYIDDVYIEKISGGENLVQNNGFEEEYDGKVWIKNRFYDFDLRPALKNTVEDNIAHELLISPHYLTAGMLEAYPEMKGGTKHTSPNYNVNTDIAREYLEEYLRTLMPYVKDNDAVQSIVMANEPHMASATLPWFYQDKWESFLKDKYGEIENLNKAWAENYDTFEGIAMPSWQSYDMRYYDYLKFNDDQFAQWYKWMKSIIREYTDKPVHVKIMGTLGEQDHQGIDRRYKTYFAMNPEPYAEFCEWNGNDCILFPNWVKSGEEGELEKSFYYDYQTSLKNAPVINTEDHIIYDQDSNYSDDFYPDFVETDLWQGLFHGRTVSDVWTWARANGDTTSIFNGLFLDRPDCVAEVSNVALDANRYPYEITAVRDEKRDTAILYSISSRVYQTDYMNAVYKAYEACEYNGKHPMIINEEQIEKIMDCDLLIIPHATHCTAAATAKIKEFIEKGGKVLIFGDDSLQYTEETNTENDKAVRDYIFANAKYADCKADGNFLSEPSDKDFSDIVESFLKENNKQYIRLIDTATGDTTDNVEWMYGIKDGKIYVNICNYNIDSTVNVNVEINGKIIESAKELRSRQTVGRDIELKRYSPILLEIETDNTFFDTYGHWSENEVKALANEGIVNGVSESRFAPDSQITRAEFLTLCLKAIGEETNSKTTGFSDVSDDDWLAGVISKAEKLGLCDEMESGTEISPNKAITREEIMTVLAKAYEYKGKTLSEKASESFSDIDSVGTVFKPYVEKAIGMGWVKGDNGKLSPNNTSTRAEAAALIGRFSEDL